MKISAVHINLYEDWRKKGQKIQIIKTRNARTGITINLKGGKKWLQGNTKNDSKWDILGEIYKFLKRQKQLKLSQEEIHFFFFNHLSFQSIWSQLLHRFTDRNLIIFLWPSFPKPYVKMPFGHLFFGANFSRFSRPACPDTLASVTEIAALFHLFVSGVFGASTILVLLL